MSKIAFLGLGAMGSRMVANLVQAGHEVTVWNRTPKELAGTTTAATPLEAVAGAEFVLSMVRDDKASRSVWFDDNIGALNGLEANSIAIEMSTLTPQWITKLADSVSASSARFLEAPVAGSRPQAQSGDLIILAGGQASTLEHARQVLSVLGSTIHHVGVAGQGAIMKLVVNSLFGIQVAAVAELMEVMERYDMDLARTLEILASMPVMSKAASGAAQLMNSEIFSPMFPIELVEKDFGYMIDCAFRAGTDLPACKAVHEIFLNAIASGYGKNNITGVRQCYKSG